MHESVAHARLMNIARFRVAYLEVMVSAMCICVRYKFSVQSENILHQMPPELLYVFPFPLPPYKLPPGFKQIFY